MSRNTTKTGRGGVPKTPKDNTTGSSTTGSSIKQYMTRGGSPGKTHLEPQTLNTAEGKTGENNRRAQTPDHSREELLAENTLETTRLEELRLDTQYPSKNEISEMFKSLEASIKQEIQALRTDLGNILARVEQTEDTIDKHERDLLDLKNQLKTIQQNQIKISYRLEDQENRNRRQNLRIRGVPEKRGEELRKIIVAIFTPILELDGRDFPKIERVHRVGRFDAKRTERSRDIIVRFSFYEDKENLWIKLRGKTPLKYEEARVLVFADLAKDTLARRRHLKPLLDQMVKQNIKYTWGFPACLFGSKDGRTARLRFPEELGDFCEKLGIQAPPLLDWFNEQWVVLGI